MAGRGKGDGWGLPRRPYKDGGNVRVEFYHNPLVLSNNSDTFDIPDRYVKYGYWYALWRMFEKEGDGQDFETAEHYKKRWEMGLARMQRRKEEAEASNRTGILGGNTGFHRSRPPRPRLPWQFGRRVR